MTTIGDQQLVKRINRSVLLRLLRAQARASRARGWPPRAGSPSPP